METNRIDGNFVNFLAPIQILCAWYKRSSGVKFVWEKQVSEY